MTGPGRLSLARLNVLPAEEALARCGGFFESSPWIVERALERRPFASLAGFHAACLGALSRAGEEERLGVIRAHPDLVGRMAREGRLTAESGREQAAAGLDVLAPEEAAAFEDYNARYKERFGFPFVICARRNRKEAILRAFPVRLERDREAEIAAAIAEIGDIAWLRMTDAIEG